MDISDVSPLVLAYDGGYELILTGLFDLNRALRVFLGPAGDSSDPPCYPATPGKGKDVYAISASKIRVFSPVMDPLVTDHILSLYDPDNVAITFASPLQVRPPFFYTQVFALRSMLPVDYATGPRNLASARPPL